MIPLIKPKQVTLKTQDGDEERTYTISKLPATVGRELVAKYPISAMPKIGDYKVNEEMMYLMMQYVEVETDNGPLRLTTKALVNNHAPDWEILARLEMAMAEYNVSFFAKGTTSLFSGGFVSLVKRLTTAISTGLSESSSAKGKQPSTN